MEIARSMGIIHSLPAADVDAADGAELRRPGAGTLARVLEYFAG
jgi:hypothetical protein